MTNVERFLGALSNYEKVIRRRSQELAESGIENAAVDFYMMGLIGAVEEIWQIIFDSGLCYEENIDEVD